MLQNPSDPDATFRSKAGEEHRGYVANLEESVGENGSVITDYQFEQNTYSDSQFLHDSWEKMDTQEEAVILATDGAYPTPENQKLAESKNVQIVSTRRDVLSGTSYENQMKPVVMGNAAIYRDLSVLCRQVFLRYGIIVKNTCYGCPSCDTIAANRLKLAFGRY
jgi:hypothetical protein